MKNYSALGGLDELGNEDLARWIPKGTYTRVIFFKPWISWWFSVSKTVWVCYEVKSLQLRSCLNLFGGVTVISNLSFGKRLLQPAKAARVCQRNLLKNMVELIGIEPTTSWMPFDAGQHVRVPCFLSVLAITWKSSEMSLESCALFDPLLPFHFTVLFT